MNENRRAEATPKTKLPRRRILKAALGVPTAAALGVGAAVYSDYRSPPPSDPRDWHAFLTDDERRHPLAKYWYRTAPVADDVLYALRSGPIAPAQMLRWPDRVGLSDAGDLPVENGWCVLPDATQYVAVRTRFPGCSAAMIDWWFQWAQKKENIRYKIWYPGAHYSMSEAPTPTGGANRNTARGKPYWGMSRFPVEDIGMGVMRMRLDFIDPQEFGFESTPDGGTIVCVRVGLPNGLVKHTDMIHHVRTVPDGVEMRSRFWMARDFEAMAGGTGAVASVADVRFVKNRVLKPNAARELAFHCAQEYSQLASFLPELYEKYGPGA